MNKRLPISNTIGIGMTMFAFIGFTPAVLSNIFGLSLGWGIFTTAIAFPIIYCPIIYLVVNGDTKKEKSE